MLKKTIKYTNYDGIEKEKDFFFNLKKSELVDLQYKTSKGFKWKDLSHKRYDIKKI